jgi:hypothetical protein
MPPKRERLPEDPNGRRKGYNPVGGAKSRLEPMLSSAPFMAPETRPPRSCLTDSGQRITYNGAL